MIGVVLAEVLAGVGSEICTIQATEEGAFAAVARDNPHLMIVGLGLAKTPAFRQARGQT